MSEHARFVVKRIYTAPSESDGYRVLVDRLWPRGVSKSKAAVDLWAKDIAPSRELRQRFHRQSIDFHEFTSCYRAELDAIPNVVQLVIGLDAPVITLLYAARNGTENHAMVLCDYLSNCEPRT